MGNPYGRLSLAAIVVAGLLAFVFLSFFKLPDLSLEHLSSPYVKIVRMGEVPGHGSGTYLGNGFILTANHVLRDAKEFQVKADDGRTFPAVVVSQDATSDSAVLRIEAPADLQSNEVSCRTPETGEYVTTTGNPYDMEFVTLWGRVASKALPVEIEGVSLSALVTLDMTASKGVSGAGIRDEAGRVVGLMTGVMFDRGVPVAYAYSVPASAFCPLLKQAGAI